MMDLYYDPISARCRAVLLTAQALGIKVNIKPISLAAGEQLKEDFLKINFEHTVPTLIDGDFKLWESRPIMIYLVEKYGKNDSLYPKDPKAKALVNQRMFFDMGSLYQKFAEYYYPQIFAKQPADPEKYKPMETVMEYFNIYLEGQKFAAGDHLTLADITLVATISNFDVFGFDLKKFDNVWTWYQRCKKAIPSYEINEIGAKQFKKLFS